MKKTILTIDGMMCGMCESHVNDAIRANFNVKKVSSSHAKTAAKFFPKTHSTKKKRRKFWARWAIK